MSLAQSRHSGLHGRRSRWRILARSGAILLVLAVAYTGLPRHPDLRRFDPIAMADAETAMWRHYYEKRYLALFADLYGVSRDQYGFSPWDSLRLALSAARAAAAFQPTRSRAEAGAALPYLQTYFALLAHATPQPIDVTTAARIELDWWQARREDRGPEEYGLLIAQVTSLLYGLDNPDMQAAGLRRAQAMAYRDAQASRMTEADWALIDNELKDAYRTLKRALASPSP